MNLTIEQKIHYADIIARVMIFAAVVFIGYGVVVKVTIGDLGMANLIAETGLVFGALFLVAVYVKKKLQQRIDAGKTFHSQG